MAESGEKELRKAFEGTTKRNIEAVIEYGKDTRTLVRNLEDRVNSLQNLVFSRDKEITQLRQQMGMLLTRLCAGGTTEEG